MKTKIFRFYCSIDMLKLVILRAFFMQINQVGKDQVLVTAGHFIPW